MDDGAIIPGNRAPTVVAEVGCSHCGEMHLAEECIKMASMFCDADYVKFQKRNPVRWYCDYYDVCLSIGYPDDEGSTP